MLELAFRAALAERLGEPAASWPNGNLNLSGNIMATVRYHWDYPSVNLLMERNGSGDTIAEYTNEPGVFGPLVSQHRDGQTYSHHYDALGSTRVVTDQNQDIVEKATYSAFGETVEKVGGITNPFGFAGATGYYANASSDATYVRARVYEPVFARWLSSDPLELDWEYSDQISLYAYSANAPTTRLDPSGLVPCDAQEASEAKKHCELKYPNPGLPDVIAWGCIRVVITKPLGPAGALVGCDYTVRTATHLLFWTMSVLRELVP